MECGTKSQAHIAVDCSSRKHYEALCSALAASWGCPAKKALPADLAPRQRNPNGSRVATTQHHDRARLHPTQWTRAFSEKLTLLASNTKYGHEAVVKELGKQVNMRQKQVNHPLHYARELLTSDIDTVIEHFSHHEHTANRGSVHPTQDGFALDVDSEGETRDRIRRMRKLRRSKKIASRGGKKIIEQGEEEGKVDDD